MGLDALLEALEPLAAAADFRLMLVGDGPERNRLEGLARRGALAQKVRFLGRLSDSDLALAYQAADLFVLPSYSEGFTTAILEAMAAAVPVVATRVSAIPEIVADGMTGALVAPGDDEAVAAALIELLGNPERRRVLGEAGRERVRNDFSVARMTDRTIAVYEGVAR